MERNLATRGVIAAYFLLVLVWVGITRAAPTPEEAYASADSILNADATAAESYHLPLYDCLWVMMKTKATGGSMQSLILRLQWDLLGDTGNHVQIRRMALQGLRHQKVDSVEQLVADYLGDSEYLLRVAAAEVATEFGNKDGADVLHADEVYDAMLYLDVDNAQSLLESATSTASPSGRMKAAFELDRAYGGTERYTTALNVLDDYVDRSHTYEDESNTRASIFWAFFFGQDTTWNEMKTYIEEAVADTSHSFRASGMCALVSFGMKGVTDSWDMLESLATDSPYEEIREQSTIWYNEFVGTDSRYRRHP